MFLCSYSPYPCNSNPMSTVYTHYVFFVCIMYLPPDVCIYIYYVHLPNAGYVQHLLFPIPFCHTTLPHPPSYLHPADLKQMGPPLCAVVLLKVPSCLTGS